MCVHSDQAVKDGPLSTRGVHPPPRNGFTLVPGGITARLPGVERHAGGPSVPIGGWVATNPGTAGGGAEEGAAWSTDRPGEVRRP